MFIEMTQFLQGARAASALKATPKLATFGKSFLRTTGTYAVVIVVFDGLTFAFKKIVNKDQPVEKVERTTFGKVSHATEATAQYVVGVGVQAAGMYPFVYIGLPGLMVTGAAVVGTAIIETPVRLVMGRKNVEVEINDAEEMEEVLTAAFPDKTEEVKAFTRNFKWTIWVAERMNKFVLTPALWPSNFTERIGGDIKTSRRPIRRFFRKDDRTTAEILEEMTKMAQSAGFHVQFVQGPPDATNDDAMHAHGVGFAMSEELADLLRAAHAQEEAQHFGSGGPAAAPESSSSDEEHTPA